MANKKEFVYEVKVVVEDQDGNPVEQTVKKTAKSIEDLEKAVKETSDAANKAPLGSKEFKKATENARKASKALDEAKSSAMTFGEKMAAIPGPIGQAVQSVQGLSKTLLASPIGIITLALGALFKAFTSTKKGAEVLQQATAALGAVMDVLRDVVVTVGEKIASAFSDPKQAILDLWETIKTNFVNRIKGIVEFLPAVGKAIKQAFSGEFKEAAKTATNAIGKITLGVEDVVGKTEQFIEKTKEVVKEMVNEGKAAAALTARLQNIEDRQRALNVERAKQNALISEAKKRATDETLSYEERTKALEEAAAAEQNLLNKEIGLAEERLSAKRALAAQSDSDAATLDELAQLEITLANLREQSINKQKELQDQKKALNDRQRADMKALADFEKQLNEDLETDERKKQQQQLENQRQAQYEQIDLLKTTEEEKARLKLKVDEKYQQDKQALEEQYAKEDREKALGRLDTKLELLSIKNAEDLENLKTLLNEKMTLELSNEELTDDERNLIKKKYDEAYLASEDELNQGLLESARQKADIAIQGLEVIKQVAGEGTAAAKAAGIAQALINTYMGVTEVLGNKTTLPEPFGTIQKIVSTATVLVAGLKSVQQIRSTKKPEVGGSTVKRFSQGGIVSGMGTSTSDSVPAMLSNGESVMNAKTTSMFSPLLSTLNQLGGGAAFNPDVLSRGTTAGNNNTPVIKTYVVSSDVTTEQQLERQQKTRSLI